MKSAGLRWVNFHVMRRTHVTLMKEIADDPKLVPTNSVTLSMSI